MKKLQKTVQKSCLTFLKLEPRCFLDILKANLRNILSFCSEPIPEISKQTLTLKYSYKNQDLLIGTKMGGSAPPPLQYTVTS